MKKDEKPLEGFDILSNFLTGNKDGLKIPTIDDNSFQDIDPEDLEKQLNNPPDDTKKVDPKTKDTTPPAKADDTKTKKVDPPTDVDDDESKKQTPPSDEPSPEDLEYEADVSSFFGKELIKKLGIDSEDDKDLKFDKIDDVIELMSEIINENSKPTYSSPEVEEFDEFVRNGGSLRDFYKEVYSGKLNVDSVNLEDTSDQRAIIRENLLNQGYKEDKIKKMISRYEEAETLKEEAEDALDLLKEFNEKKTKSLLESQKKEAAEVRKKQQKFYEDVNSTIKTISNFKGFPVSEKEKRELLEYAFVPDEDGFTKYQKEFRGDVYHILESAYFVKNKNKIKAGDANKKENTDAYKTLRDKVKARSNKVIIDDNSKSNSGRSSLGDFGKGIIF